MCRGGTEQCAAAPGEPTCPPDRPSKILLVQVGTLSSSPIPRLGFLLSFFLLRYFWNMHTHFTALGRT